MEIIPGIHQVDGVNANCYILVRDSLIIIDTGLPGSGKKILAYIRERLHRDPAEIRTIIITHFHLDHTGGVAAMKEGVPDVKVAVGNGDEVYVNGTLPEPGTFRVDGDADALVHLHHATRSFFTGYPP